MEANGKSYSTIKKELKEASMKGVWLSRLDAYVNAYNKWIK